jgi:hypothetical protein
VSSAAFHEKGERAESDLGDKWTRRSIRRRRGDHLEKLDEGVLAEARLREALPDLPRDFNRRVRHCGAVPPRACGP